MSKGNRGSLDSTALDDLIEEIKLDANGDAEQIGAFQQAFEDTVSVPFEAFVIGEPVSVIGFDYDGNERRGLTARCRRADGSDYVIAACEIACPAGAQPERYLAAYRRWMGLAPIANKVIKTVAARAIASEMVVLSIKRKSAHCRLLGADRVVMLRSGGPLDAVPGEIVLVRSNEWRHTSGSDCLSGEIESVRLDATALGLTPLKLESRGVWDPGRHYWGEEGEPIEKWARPIIAHGPRPEFEMQQVLPGGDPEDPFSDPITESVDRKDAGDHAGARRILMDLCRADLRCLDAHVHLGNLVFDRRPADAIRHYAAGVRIGELSMAAGLDGVLPWGWIDNRPFLRCLHGYGLCLWRLGKFKSAAEVFQRMLWLNPGDNQGVRFLIGEVRKRASWETSRQE